MRKRKNQTIISVFLIFCLLLTACGKTGQEEIPELLEPVSINAGYHPVQRGNIEALTVVMGTVVPMPYCHFYPVSTVISGIEVDIGDYVEEGTVLAYADIESVRKEIASLEKSRELMDAQDETDQVIYDETIKQLNYRKKAYLEAGASSDAEAVKTQIAVTEENHRYDGMLADIHRKKLDEEIEALKEIEAEGTLRAYHSGYVTYIKDLSASREAAAMENVVVISDMEDPYIELKDWCADKNYRTLLGRSKRIYTKFENREYAVTELEYTDDELISAEVAQQYPNVRLMVEDPSMLKVGDTLPIFYSSGGKTDVLMIGNDSVYQEGEETFVYIKNETGGQERRNVELGISDALHTEVIDGLTEGELVYYKSDSVAPASYYEYTVEQKDFLLECKTGYYRVADSLSYPYCAEVDGVLAEISAPQGTAVKKGDLLYILDNGGGRAALEEANNAIRHAEKAYQEEQKSYDSQIAEKKAAIEAHKNQEAPTATDTDAQKEYLYQEEQLNCDIQILAAQKRLSEKNYNYNLEELKQAYNDIQSGNDGSGKIHVYAEEDGVVTNVPHSQGDRVSEGSAILVLQCSAGDKLLITADRKQNKRASAANIGQHFTFQYDGKTCEGVSIGGKGLEGKYYAGTVDGEVYITFCDPSSGGETQFYASVDDDTVYREEPEAEITYAGIQVRDCIVIPEELIYKEHDSETDTDFWYVWLLKDGELQKQYVMTSDIFSGNGEVMILSGLSAGDVLAGENGLETGGEE